MNLIRIVIKEFKQNLRDWRPNALMILFPIVLMSVLGAALSGMFDRSIALNVSALYTVKEDGPLARAFDGFKGSVGGMGVRFTPADSEEAGTLAVKNVTYACYLVVSDSGISLYKNDRFSFEADFVQSLLQAFLQRYNTVRAIATVDPTAALRVANETGGSRVETASLETNRSPRSIDYYAITMLTLTIMYAALFGMSGIKKELKLKTANRILVAPVGRWQLLAGKVIGGLAVTAVQILTVVLFSRYVIGAYWGTDIVTVALILLAQAAMAVSLGAGIAYLVSNEGAANGILNSIFPVMVLFAGGYAPIENIGPVFDTISKLDPIKWVNRSILGVIYNRDYSAVAPALISCLGVAAAFILAAALLSRKETV